MRFLTGIFILLFLLLSFSRCNKKQRGHFSSRPSKPSKIKGSQGNIYDCDVMEKNRAKRAKQAQKGKKPEVKDVSKGKTKTESKVTSKESSK
jgi:hypothetical protein